MAAELLAVGAGLGYLYWNAHRRHRDALRAERAAVFDHCAGLLEAPSLVQDDVDYPTLSGLKQGRRCRLRTFTDQVTWRKLPALWLQVDLLAPLPWAGVVDCLVRPVNTEFWSPVWSLGHSLALPAGWPQHALLRTDRPEALPPLERLEAGRGFFEDPRAKELLVTPNGVRLVYLADEGSRLYHGVLRQARFEHLPLARDLVDGLLDRAFALYNDLHEG